MRGKGVSALQELLQRMGYPMQDQPGLFGTSTRDAVKDFQSRKGLKSTGLVDDELLELMRQNFSSKGDNHREESKVAPPPLSGGSQKQLDAITRLLIQKGILTEQELADELARPQPLRVVQPPLT